MNYFLITLVAFVIIIPAMAIGFIFAKKELKGSCGGLGKIMGDDCMFCDKKDECESDKHDHDHDHDCEGEQECESIRLECTDSGEVILKEK